MPPKTLFSVHVGVAEGGMPLFAWDPRGQVLASVSRHHNRMNLFDRRGSLLDQVQFSGKTKVRMMDWDRDGEVLAILQQEASTVLLYHRNARRVEEFDPKQKDISFIRWSKAGPSLAIGTTKGNLVVFNRKTLKRYPVIGKHTKRIILGDWGNRNELALGGEDKMVTVSTAEGDALDQVPLTSVPLEVRFSRIKSVSKSNFSEGSVSANLSKTLLLLDVRSTKKPTELEFSKKYGDIVRHEWFGDGYIFLGFSSGYIAVLSTFSEEVGREIYARKMHSRSLYDIAISKESNLVATCGDDGIAFLDMSDLQRIHEDERLRIAMRPSGQSGVPMKVEWTSDGQILSAGTHAEKLISFLVRVPTLVASRGSDVVFLVSLREVAVRSLISGDVKSTHKIDIEPDFLAIGPAHVAVGMNNQIWFYDIRGSSSKEVLSKEYIGTIDKVAISMFFVAVLCDRQVFLQVLDVSRQSFLGQGGPKASGRIQRAFPESEEKDITCMHLDDKFLIYGTSKGELVYFSLEDWSVVNEYHHSVGIRKIFPNKSSIRCVLFDESGKAFVYSALDDHLVQFDVDGFDPNDALWDLETPGVFAVTSASRKVARMYSYAPQSRVGPRVDECFHPDEKHAVYEVEMSSDNPPLCLSGGYFRMNATSGVSETPTDIYDTKIGKHMTREQVEARFYWALQLNLLEFAWEAAMVLSKNSHWITLARKAMNLLDVEMAIKSYQKANEIGMVIALTPLQNEGEKALLSGHLSLLLGEYDVAQSLFLESSEPIHALHMQRDLMHWDQALRLAQTLAEDEVPLICKEYGVQLEFDGDFSGALNMFERAQEGGRLDEESRNVCEQGTARNLIRTGDVRAGVAMAESIGQKTLFVECGRILEDIKQLNEAAAFYEKAQMYEKAASIYIQSKNFAAAKPIMDFIRSTKLHVLYAKAKEAEGNFRAAVQSYEIANDLVSVVNLSLNKLNEPEKAFEIARKSRSPEAAALVAKFCQKTGDHRGAIEFSILSRRSDLAFNMAKTTNEMAFFAEQVGEHGSPKQYQDIASYYESKDDFSQAAAFHEKCGETERALELYLRGGEKYLDQAIDLVGRARSEELIHTLASFVLGESDGIVKDMKYVFKLYIVLENYERAAQTAVMIAEQELEFGNYANARRVLFETYQELRAHHVSIPQKLRRTLLLLHSYVIVKPLMKSGDHESAARMLLRVAKNISKFHQHIVPILTLTVVESHRAGLKETATEYAAMLCRPEYRENIAEQYRRKIEGLVRRRKKEEDVEEGVSPCPFCGRDVPLTRLDCPHCLSIIPYCIVTGRHMVKDDFSFCPQCRFPALFSEFSKHVAKTKTCPMCEKTVSISDVEKVGDVVGWIKKESHHESTDSPDSEKHAEEGALE